MDSNAIKLDKLIVGMRAAYARGANVMEYARRTLDTDVNLATATLIAYDLQAGSYTKGAIANPEARDIWCRQLANILNPIIGASDTLLEVGCGEATTLAGVLEHLNDAPCAYGFDISWSRCSYGRKWLSQKEVRADLFVADLFNIPMQDSCVDVIYTSHSLEPNGGSEEVAIQELLRVARRKIVLVEPAYELASAEAQERMKRHGYVRGLKQTAEKLGATVEEYRLLDYTFNPLNPSALLVISKKESSKAQNYLPQWRCPLTHTPLTVTSEGYFSNSAGMVYPVLGGIPLLRSTHAVIASAFGSAI